MIKLILLFIIVSGLSYFVLSLSEGIVQPLFSNILSVFVPITILFGALSFALYNFLEGISKDLPKRLLESKPEDYSNALNALSELKREVISNVLLVIGLLLLERLFFGVCEVIENTNSNIPEWISWSIISLRVSCFVVVIYAVFEQLRGFLTADKLRSILMEHQS